ncbi:MAG TPA: 2'-5' RNA ligase family protein [Phnomibacter sp.]|nr:2'-5' RNA ligase family protein [Phnomibacter sp.]
MSLSSTIAQPVYPIDQYLLIIRPSLPVEQRIRRLKNEIREAFDLKVHNMQGGYVLLARFSQYALLENKMTDKLRLIAMEARPFLVELKDYYSHPDHVVGLRVANPAGIQALQKALRQDQRLLHVPGHSAYFNPHPAVALASRLQPEQYGAIWKKYKNRHFHAKFVADNMVLLRKRAGDSRWIVVDQMTLQNLPVSSRQGVLF